MTSHEDTGCRMQQADLLSRSEVIPSKDCLRLYGLLLSIVTAEGL